MIELENVRAIYARTVALDALQLTIQPGIEVVGTAANGREAIRAIKTNKPDLVFLDIQMPGFDGFSVIQGLMEVEPPLFVFVTAYVDHALRGFEAGAVDYLTKPVDIARLKTILAQQKGNVVRDVVFTVGDRTLRALASAMRRMIASGSGSE